MMNCTGIPSVCVSPMWPKIMNINDCNRWQLSATRYGNRVRWLFPCLHGIEKVVIWFTEDIIRLAFATSLIYLGIWLCKIPVVVTNLSNHLHELQVLLLCKIGCQSHFLSIHSPAYKTYSCMIYSNRLVTLLLKMATWLVFAGRWTEKRLHSAFVYFCIVK